MHALEHSFRGLSLLMAINWDRILFVGAIAAGLLAGAYLGGL